MALSKLAANSFDLTDNYAFTGTTTGATSTQKLFLIKNIDASSSGTVDFVNGASSVVLDNTYKTYLFRCVNIHPATDNVAFQINFRDGGSNYDATKTTTFFDSGHSEDDSTVASLAYDTGADVAQGTGPQIAENIGNGADESIAGELFLFDPSSTTFVKHWISKFHTYNQADYAGSHFASGYVNSTSAVTGVRFTSSSGNIQAGTIEMYGIN